jgi:putative ABC transport system permease protein
MAQHRGDLIADRRFTLILVGVFAALALILASIGIYGVISYSVAQRTREIGIRMALGASQRQVLQMVVGGGAKLAALGIVIGAAGALGLTQFIRSFLYGVSPSDPLTFAGISLILGSVALLASYVPARRAMKVDPNTALRYE